MLILLIFTLLFTNADCYEEIVNINISSYKLPQRACLITNSEHCLPTERLSLPKSVLGLLESSNRKRRIIYKNTKDSFYCTSSILEQKKDGNFPFPLSQSLEDQSEILKSLIPMSKTCLRNTKLSTLIEYCHLKTVKIILSPRDSIKNPSLLEDGINVVAITATYRPGPSTTEIFDNINNNFIMTYFYRFGNDWQEVLVEFKCQKGSVEGIESIYKFNDKFHLVIITSRVCKENFNDTRPVQNIVCFPLYEHDTLTAVQNWGEENLPFEQQYRTSANNFANSHSF